MRFPTEGFPARGAWHHWFAWYPVRIPSNVYEPGVWIWLEWIERQEEIIECGMAGSDSKYHHRLGLEQTEAPRP